MRCDVRRATAIARSLAAAVWLAACVPDTSTSPSVPASLSVVSGLGQTVVAGGPAAQPFIVLVADANGNSMSGVIVQWAIVSGSGSLSASSGPTDKNGQAHVTYTPGSAGVTDVTATVGLAVPADTFAVTVTPKTSAAPPASAVAGAGRN